MPPAQMAWLLEVGNLLGLHELAGFSSFGSPLGFMVCGAHLQLGCTTVRLVQL